MSTPNVPRGTYLPAEPNMLGFRAVTVGGTGYHFHARTDLSVIGVGIVRPYGYARGFHAALDITSGPELELARQVWLRETPVEILLDLLRERWPDL